MRKKRGKEPAVPGNREGARMRDGAARRGAKIDRFREKIKRKGNEVITKCINRQLQIR